MTPSFDLLYETAFNYPAIDNHAHPLLKIAHRDKIPFEVVISEADNFVDSIHTLACMRATAQLAPILDLERDTATWEDIKAARANVPYEKLCKTLMDKCKIRCLLLDDGLGGVAEYAEDWKWHAEQFCEAKRVVRVEIEAEKILRDILTPNPNPHGFFDLFTQKLKDVLVASANDPAVVAFKSIVCYRTGLDVSVQIPKSLDDITMAYLRSMYTAYKEKGVLRLANKELNDLVVHLALQVAGECGVPVQFHTGLGDSDISLLHSSPAHMQPLIKAYPRSQFVLLHSSYPYTREAGYLTAVYDNVFLDFGEVFPLVSGSGQRDIIRQLLELAPTNKILWSTDGHWHPETFYLSTIQARQALYDVLKETVQAGEMTERQAIGIVQNALFHNSNKLYKLGLNVK